MGGGDMDVQVVDMGEHVPALHIGAQVLTVRLLIEIDPVHVLAGVCACVGEARRDLDDAIERVRRVGAVALSERSVRGGIYLRKG